MNMSSGSAAGLHLLADNSSISTSWHSFYNRFALFLFTNSLRDTSLFFMHFLSIAVVDQLLMVRFYLSCDPRASARCSQRGILHHRCGILRTGCHLLQTGKTGAEQQPAQEGGEHPAREHFFSFIHILAQTTLQFLSWSFF